MQCGKRDPEGEAPRINYTGFTIITDLNLVRERWGTGAYEDLIDEMIFTQEFKVSEQHLYGSSRLGIRYADTTMFRREFTITGFDSLGQFIVDEVLDSVRLHIDDSNYYRTLAMKQFEMTNHPGNACPNAGGRRVLATVTDRTTPVGTTAITAYKADIISAQYYYPFGSPMTKWESDTSYRYKFGFNGQEKDDEVAGAGNITTAMFWEYDSRLGRRWNLDPKRTVSVSDYSCFYSNPLWNTDVLGDKPTPKEAAAMASHVYGDKKDGILQGGWRVSNQTFENVKLTDASSGFKSAVYEREITSGVNKGEMEYAYATAGKVWGENLSQPVGQSDQYKQSMSNAPELDKQLGSKELTFVGHSLGGGEVQQMHIKREEML